MSARVFHIDSGRGYAGRATTFLEVHRGIAQPALRARPVAMIGLGLALSAAWMLALPWVGSLWVAMYEWLARSTALTDRVFAVHYVAWGRTLFVLPEMQLAAPDPTGTVLAAHGLACLGLFVGTRFIDPDRAPLRYSIRVLALIHGTSVAFHALPGRGLPYDPGSYVSGMMLVGASAAALTPVVLGATHFLFDFGPVRKVGLAVLTLAYFAVLVPIQYAAHAVVLHYGGMIYMPLLFIVFGLPVEVFAFIGLYSWGMSWKDRRDRAPVTAHPALR